LELACCLARRLLLPYTFIVVETLACRISPDVARLFRGLSCFTRAGVGCGNWGGQMSSTKAFKTQTTDEKSTIKIRGRHP
jgi:hypothetical protein